ncbi:MAG TPA: DapH/DapD/GlmU-related protein [Acidobacteriota bacterium]|nr:DapH/DapD/GlmU-related protein [Acidobacteriota bacterium]HQG92176.1 DapH/DapD/GlmU-related protein [Acidobacteriota bacterium]HQK87124.1 DapH/DapD/GlmU-related protein [Acidobacteriota bacterium]
MSNRQHETPEDAMRRVTAEIVGRAARYARRRGLDVRISKTSRGAGTPVVELDPATPAGKARLAEYLARPARHYTLAGLGAPEDPNAVNWRKVNLPAPRRTLLTVMVGISFLLKGTPFKNRWYRWMGVHVGRNVEVMQMVWLDHFRPELVFIGDNTLVGAFSQFTVHAYEGRGRFRFGLVEVGRNCTIGAGAGLGMIKVEDDVRILPGTVVSPYYPRIKAGTVVGYDPPPKSSPTAREQSETVDS